MSMFESTQENFAYVFFLSFFNGISTFVGYLMPKPFFKKNSIGTISPITGRIRGFIHFPRVSARK